MLRIEEIAVHVFRVPLTAPVRTSFGIMRDRPAVLIELKDRDGAVGWGEIFCNWPAAGAEHRARLLLEDIADLVFAEDWPTPNDLFENLTDRTHIKVLQTGEIGPFAQVIAGIDIAAWDLFAKRAGKPLARALCETSSPSVPVYASGIQIDDAPTMIAGARDAGYRAFKVKVGFDVIEDAEKVRALAATFAPDERLMVDANQAWSERTAADFLAAVKDVGLDWLEEPMPIDAPDDAWARLAARNGVPLAGGENMCGRFAFDHAVRTRALSVIQPDAAKWGGITGCYQVAAAINDAGLRYCPHFLGAGVGLLASAHLVAAAGGTGLLEIDVNPNPLRSEMFSDWPRIDAGATGLPTGAGLGLTPDLTGFEGYRTFTGSTQC